MEILVLITTPDLQYKHSALCVALQAAGFFKGMSFPLVSITLYNSLVFGCFSNTQRFISRYRHGDARHPSTLLDLTLASALTGLVSVAVGAPVDLVKIRLQMQTQPMVTENLHLATGMSAVRLRPLAVGVHHHGPLQVISRVVQSEGLCGLYRGGGAMLLRDVPGYALYFIPYTLLCRKLSSEHTHSPQPFTICLAGGLAGVFPRLVGERYPRVPHVCYHVPDLRDVPEVLQESVGRRRSRTGTSRDYTHTHLSVCVNPAELEHCV
ncbi:solute carrier family 25 member 48 isoform X1 [Gouania willdenowi]|uniref:solute carrier family 25 member 48 isoform X1 n=1 Tax=Gouania willdenowi TaxID=441366 RepID=UPI0010546481|nr:solute carrier family 25 member 48 isoform X1 [Gouania willdenowi]